LRTLRYIAALLPGQPSLRSVPALNADLKVPKLSAEF
jgi:hypothetical protein